uniref:Uncharacterized protein n=1 Tax=Meloidogyne incognita TaxID=6306 RepID=A0A914MW94_MELIC
MNFKLFSLTILSLLFLLFDKGSGKIRLRASRLEFEEINNEELSTSTEMPTDDQNNATDLPTGTYEQTSEATTASNYIRTRKGFARAMNRWDEYEEEEEYEKEENDGSPFVKFSEGNDSVKVREAREAIELNETTEYPQTIDEQSTANDLSTTTGNNEAHEEEKEEEDDDEQEQGEENPNPPEKEKNETKYVSNFDGEKCFITTSDKESEIFKDMYAVKGDVIYNEKQSEGIGISTLEKLSNFKCGIKNYDQYSYCAKVKLFGKLELKDIREGKQLEPNDPKNITQYKEHSLQDTALVLIEGCFSCKNSDKGPINITFWQINEAGPIKDACPAEEKLISHYVLDYEKYNGSFIVGGILHERLCPARETLEDKIELAQLKYKHNFKIVIEHSCAGTKASYVSKFAKAIDFENLKEHIFELRDLNINLNQNEETFDWDWNDKKEGFGYTYFAAKEFKQLNDSEIAQGEDVLHSEYITDENEGDDDEDNDEEENVHHEGKQGEEDNHEEEEKEKDNHDEEKQGEVINEEKSEEENEKKENYEEEKMKKLHEELEVVSAGVKEEDKNMLKEVALEAEEKKNESLADPEQFKENLEALNSTNEEMETNETINYQTEQITQEEEIKVEGKNPEKSGQITQKEGINEDNKEKKEEKSEEIEKIEEKNEADEKKEEDKDEKGKVEEMEKVDEVKKE